SKDQIRQVLSAQRLHLPQVASVECRPVLEGKGADATACIATRIQRSDGQTLTYAASVGQTRLLVEELKRARASLAEAELMWLAE
ncbi:hypothetical protein KIPB_012626, partial [Kipferlia bialata]